MTTVHLRQANVEELSSLTELCLRSKAHWGYDAAFMAACRDELTVRADDIPNTIVASLDGCVVGLAEISIGDERAELERLYVQPENMGLGIGRKLFDWCRGTAAARGAHAMNIEADPDAVPFYERMGGKVVGTAPSGSIPGRVLPVLSLPLDQEPVE